MNQSDTGVQSLIRQYYRKSWRIIPTPPDTKGPREDGWQTRTYAEADMLELFSQREHGNNLVVQLGAKSGGILDVDLDSIEAQSGLAAVFLPHTEAQITRGGITTHYLYTSTEHVKGLTYKDPYITEHNKKHPDNKQKDVILELRTSDGLVTMIPPSIHPVTHERLHWQGDGTAHHTNAKGIVKRCNYLASAILLARYWPAAGSRQIAALALAGVLLRVMDQGAATAFLRAVCGYADDLDEWEDRRVTVIATTARKLDAGEHVTGIPTLAKLLPDGVGEQIGKWLNVATEKVNVRNELQSLGYQLSDLGNAERFRSTFGNDVRYVNAWKSFVTFDGKRWTNDNETQSIRDKANTVVRNIGEFAKTLEDEKLRDALFSHALRSESKRGLDNLIDLASTLPGIITTASTFDSEQTDYLFNCNNKLLDLSSLKNPPHPLDAGGVPRPRQIATADDHRLKYITKISQVNYDPNAESPLWDAFMYEICNGDQDMIDFLHALGGYSLTGNIDLRAYFTCFGLGANGKSTFAYALEYVGGEYVMSTSPETFMYQRDGRTYTNNIAKLRAARAVISSEPQEGRRLDESLIKQLTGGDRVTARYLFQEEFDFDWKAKIWILTNHKPVIRGQESAIWVRTYLLPFEVIIPRKRWIEREVMRTRIRLESSGILNHFLRGLQRFFENNNKLEIPQSVKNATDAYRQEMDDIGSWIADEMHTNLETSTPQTTECSNVYASYTQWCAANGNRARNSRAFTEALAEKGIHRIQTKNGQYHYRGIEYKIFQMPR